MIQEAVLDTREGDRYIGFLVEEEEWLTVQTINDPEPEHVMVHRRFLWRITDRLTGNTTEGEIPFTVEKDIRRSFEATWQMFNNSSYRPPVPEVPVEPIIPVSPYASHPNYGRF